MATSVKMDEETKSRLERLQAEIKLETGRKVTQQELLARVVDEAYVSRADLVDSFRRRTVPVGDGDRRAFNQGTVSSGVATTEEDVDDVLYG